jgi:ubiquinone/menaquinone biosynthesis C-methylase UbiE
MNFQHFLISSLIRLRDSRLLWDAMGAIYNQRIYKAISELYDEVVRQMPLDEGDSLLDVGTGRGYIAMQLAAKNPGARITGIDYSSRQIREAQKLQKQKKVLNCAFTLGNVMNIRFPEEVFDAAVSIGSIKHWPDAVRGLAEIRRVLKPGALLIVSETDQGASEAEIRRFMNRFKVWFVPDHLLFWGLRNVIFGQSFTQVSLTDAVKTAGFRRMEGLRVSEVPYVTVRAVK